MLTLSTIRVAVTNSNRRQRNAVRAYRLADDVLIAEVNPTSMYGALNYLRQHPRSKYTLDFAAQLNKAGVPDADIRAVLA